MPGTFAALKLGRATADAMERELARRLDLVTLWTKRRNLVLIGVDVRRGNGPWRQVVTKPIADGDGELTVDLGAEDPGTITVKFSIGALSEVPKIAAFVAQAGKVTQIAPAKPGEFHRLKAGETWPVEAKYEVAAPLA
jgi:hypothetical protein